MDAETIAPRLPATYYELVGKFPLTRISSEPHCDEAGAIIDQLLRQNLDEGGEAYLEALACLVGIYEDETLDLGDASAREVLAELVANSDLTEVELSETIGIAQPTVSAILGGEMEMTVDQMRRFGKHFGVPPSVFLPA